MNIVSDNNWMQVDIGGGGGGGGGSSVCVCL